MKVQWLMVFAHAADDKEADNTEARTDDEAVMSELADADTVVHVEAAAAGMMAADVDN